MFEHDNEAVESTDGKSAINNLKYIIQKLQTVTIIPKVFFKIVVFKLRTFQSNSIQELNEAREANERLKRLNIALEEKITDQLIMKRTSENVELVELRRTMVECEMELHELREQYLTLKSKAENDLTKEHKKIGTQKHVAHSNVLFEYFIYF